jgi:Anti-sigma-K factor rskA, C-terminal
MSRGPDFEDLVGHDVSGEERERLRRTHELLLAAGPPPELSPGLAAGPSLGTTLRRRSRPRGRRLYLLAAALAAAVVVAFLGGYAAGHGSGGSGQAAVWTLQLHGTAAAPQAFASLRVLPAEAGNWPMTLRVTGLPKLPADAYYEVYLVRSGDPWLSCGSFVTRSPSGPTTVTLNAPYRLESGDSWVVTRQPPNSEKPGRPVLEPVT